MAEFEKYIDRHGEGWVQTIIEQIERIEGRRSTIFCLATLEDRWNALMNNVVQQQLAA